ncbi:MAG: hypothetical protein AAGA05_10575 [Pseudomonadota bacterium]
MNFDATEDSLIYAYAAGSTAPVLDLEDNGDGTRILNAHGVAVAIIESPDLMLSDISILELAPGTNPFV